MDEEASEGLAGALNMEMEVFSGDVVEGEEGGDGTQGALGALYYADPSGTTLVDACNGFNELSRLAIMWTVRHRWPAGARYRHWEQLLLC